jgi:UDP-N-acetylglucosamine 2-epimerase
VLRRRHTEVLVHTGQHHDAAMSDRFFSDLDIPAPDINLEVGSLPPAEAVAAMMVGLGRAMEESTPDLVVVRGDTNSTIAAALVAKQRLLPLVHIEAGMRSYDRTMPEEINRIVTDHIADLNLAVDDATRERLAGEGISGDGVAVVGDVMYDIFLLARPRAAGSLAPDVAELARDDYDLVTLHRAENVDDADRLRAIVAAFDGAPRRALLPLHPRTKARLGAFGIALPSSLVAIEPQGYLQMVALETGARAIFTDSGGVQREAYFAAKPCVTLRDTTEWTNTVDAGWNRLAGASTETIARYVHGDVPVAADHPPLFGGGDAAERIVAALESETNLDRIERARAQRAARGLA